MFAVDASLTVNPIDLNQDACSPFAIKPELQCEASQDEVTMILVYRVCTLPHVGFVVSIGDTKFKKRGTCKNKKLDFFFFYIPHEEV